MHSHISSASSKCVSHIHTTIQSSPFVSTMLCSASSLRSCPYLPSMHLLSATARRSLPTLPPSTLTRLQPIQAIRHTSNLAPTYYARGARDSDKIMWLYQLPPRSTAATSSDPHASSPFSAAIPPNPLFGIAHSLPTLHANEAVVSPPTSAVAAAPQAMTESPIARAAAAAAPAVETFESEVDEDLASASMSAFAKMEAQMRAKKKQEEAAPIGEPITLQTESLTAVDTKVPLGMSNSWSIKFPLQKPLEPTAGMCCGRDCPNCVWIQYSNALADYEDEQKRMGFRGLKFTQGSQIDTLLNAKRGILEDQEPRAPVSDIDPIPSPASDSLDRGSPLSPFERAMRRERDQLRSVIKPQGKRSLGAIILPKDRDDSSSHH